jgi:hypothetical protein
MVPKSAQRLVTGEGQPELIVALFLRSGCAGCKTSIDGVARLLFMRDRSKSRELAAELIRRDGEDFPEENGSHYQ